LQVPQLDRQQIVVPVGEFGCLVVSDPVCLDLLGREIFGNVDGELIEPKLLSSFEASVPADNYPFGVDNDRLANTKLTDRCSNGIDSVIVDATIAWRTPNSRIDAATASTASSLMRGLFG